VKKRKEDFEKMPLKKENLKIDKGASPLWWVGIVRVLKG
jgi:hypothetical protein